METEKLKSALQGKADSRDHKPFSRILQRRKGDRGDKIRDSGKVEVRKNTKRNRICGNPTKGKLTNERHSEIREKLKPVLISFDEEIGRGIQNGTTLMQE